MNTLNEIEKLAKDLSDARTALREGMERLQEEVDAAKKKYLPAIRRAVERAAQRHSDLHAAVAESPDLFEKPKTYILHGIRLGYMKAKGDILWDDADKVVQLIHRHFPEQAETLIKMKETPIKTALAQLSVAELKKIGVTVQETSDQVFIKPTDSEIDKLINALLKQEEIEEDAA